MPTEPQDREDRVYCPVRASLNLLQQKWTLHIVDQLLSGKKRFNELAHALGGVNSRTLSERLKALEREGLLRRQILSSIPPWVEYELTDKGRSLQPVIRGLATWGRTWMPKPASKRGKRTGAQAARHRGYAARQSR